MHIYTQYILLIEFKKVLRGFMVVVLIGQFRENMFFTSRDKDIF